ncbi:MAG: hypothetical protein JWP87_390 [Labilithrix sp.]|nr:hypothetical protein [Labilithrix sp.]
MRRSGPSIGAGRKRPTASTARGDADRVVDAYAFGRERVIVDRELVEGPGEASADLEHIGVRGHVDVRGRIADVERVDEQMQSESTARLTPRATAPMYAPGRSLPLESTASSPPLSPRRRNRRGRSSRTAPAYSFPGPSALASGGATDTSVEASGAPGRHGRSVADRSDRVNEAPYARLRVRHASTGSEPPRGRSSSSRTASISRRRPTRTRISTRATTAGRRWC